MIRRDIQCLRGIAISLVFLYHLFPSLFRNGFLGVDIFFVLSGYLMACNLTRQDISSVSDILEFYYRRFKRILPLYYLIIFLSVIFFHFYLADSYWEGNKRYSIASIFIVTNQLIIHDSADYFRQFLSDGSSRNVFIHMWSLAVEMQFYLIVPFIFFGIQHLKGNILKLAAVTLITVLGFIPSSLLNQQFVFNFMFLRLWQFSAGFVSLFWTKTEFPVQQKSDKCDQQFKSPALFGKEDLVVVALIIIGMSLIPSKMNTLILRSLITVSTAVIIAVNSRENTIFNSKCLLYLGDISYSIYLVHWPIICFFSGSLTQDYVFCTVSTLLVSILLHHFYEKVYLKMEKPAVISLIVILILSNTCLQYSIRTHNFWKTRLSPSLQRIVDENRANVREGHLWKPDIYFEEPCVDVSKPDSPTRRVDSFGDCKFKNGNGSMSVMLIGNSYSMNILDSIRLQFHHNYSDFRYLGLSRIIPLDHFTVTNPFSDSFGLYADPQIPVSLLTLNITKTIIRDVKPDVLFIVSKYSNSFYSEIREKDDVIRQMDETLEFYQKFVKKIYILGPHPVYESNFFMNFLHYATQKPDELEDLHMKKIEVDRFLKNAFARFKKMKCSKCHVFDLSRPFIENEKFLTFDREKLVSFVDDTAHFSRPGLEFLEPEFRKTVSDLMNSSL